MNIENIVEFKMLLLKIKEITNEIVVLQERRDEILLNIKQVLPVRMKVVH